MGYREDKAEYDSPCRHSPRRPWPDLTEIASWMHLLYCCSLSISVLTSLHSSFK